MMRKELIIKDTHRGLWYEDGVLKRVLPAGRYEYPKPRRFFWEPRKPQVEVVLVDVREREQTINGRIDVEATVVKVELELPWLLAAMAEKIRPQIEQEGRKMLEEK